MSSRILTLAYAAPSRVVASPAASALSLVLAPDGREIGVHGRITEPALFRDAFLTAAAVMQSDLRYRGKDRAAYLAHLMAQGKRATKSIWEAQKKFLESAFESDTPRPRGLDPVLTVDPDEVSLEVFSRDESAYARLSLDNALFGERAASHGSSYLHLSPELLEQVERMRVYQPVTLEASSARAETPRATRELELPHAWLRGFLQVQSAATLPSSALELAPIDLYNVLLALRLRRAKKAPRGLRFELIPGARPRIVLEPWETVLECHGAPYEGSVPRVVRAYGRQRLTVLARVLPHVRRARVHLLGPGLPSFWVLDLGLARLTLGLTSWAESSWASTASFDTLMPRLEDGPAIERAVAVLREHGPLSLSEIAKRLRREASSTRALLQAACLRGEVLLDLDRQQYRPRALLSEPVELELIRYGSPREASAHRLLADKKAVRVTKLHTIAGEGQEIAGEVDDRPARRAYQPRFGVDLEGQVHDAWCNCASYQRSALREGPCEHMIALYLFHKRELAAAEARRNTPEGRALVRAETRSLVRRDASGLQTRYRVSLDDRIVRIEQQQTEPGRAPAEPRSSRLWFDTDAQAREAYYARIDALAARGFIDLEALAG